MSGTEIVHIGNRCELFVDSFMLEEISNVQLRLHTPTTRGIAFYFDRPWEGDFSGYCTIIKDDGLYRAYYRGLRYAGYDGTDSEVTCYAESSDGINWRKPNLRIHEINGNLDNNVILANVAPVTHNFSPFIDTNPLAKPNQKFKAVGGNEQSGLIAYVSADGIHWKKLQEKPVFAEGKFDSQNVVFWSRSEQKYVCYFRSWTGEGYTGFRSVSRTTSTDFVNWSAPQKMAFGSTPSEHIYTQQTSPYYRAPHIYLAIGARFMPDRQVITEGQAFTMGVDSKYYKDCSDIVLMSSRGGDRYDRTFMESFIRPGVGLENWVSRSNYPALNVIETSDTEMSIYVNEHYAQPTAHLKRYSMRVDGFVSLSAGYYGGEAVTRPFTFTGQHLEINYSSSAAGSIRIEVQDQKGNPIPGFTLQESLEIIGNEVKRQVCWKKNVDVSELAAKPIRLRFVIRDADLYSFKFS